MNSDEGKKMISFVSVRAVNSIIFKQSFPFLPEE